MPEEKTFYHCRLCGEPFEAKQGSKRTLCDKHLAERVTAPRPRKVYPEQKPKGGEMSNIHFLHIAKSKKPKGDGNA